ncbi:hypothetical protein AGDE_00386 [Angomonas deanei]|nr:hypothetical protein AGDE_00386 [Angomonas deanei]|eukprot:EPY43535.1 hypothetical protein AGDE_00386 [Angomonas deanei]
MTQSSLCVETLCANRENDPIALLRDCHAAHPSQLPIILECLEKMVSNAPPQGKIVEKALRNKLLELLLGLLEKGVNPSQMENSNPAAIRALIVRILKGLLAADSSGAVQNILKSSDVWLKYKDQSHDLFLSTNNYGGLLANHGSNGSNAPPLALTSAVSVLHSDEPPPV